VTPQEAKTHYNYLMTLCIRKEEAFGPMAFTFIKEQDLDKLGLAPGAESALVPFNTPIFSVYPVLTRQSFKFEDARSL